MGSAITNYSRAYGSAQDLSDALRRKILAGDYPPGARLPTLRELAAQTRLSYNTVAKALGILAHEGLVHAQRGAGSFVCELDTTSQRASSNLHIFALVIPHIQGGFCSSLQHGFEAAARELHRQVLVCSTENDISNQSDVILQLLDKRVNGAVIMPVGTTMTPSHQIRVLQKSGIPVVLLREVKGASAPSMVVPHEQIGWRAAVELTRSGHRQIAMCFADRGPIAERIRAGFERGLSEAGVDPSSCEAFYTKHYPWNVDDYREVERQAELFLTRDGRTRPTALFASCDELAEVLYLSLTRLGLRLPQDISLLSFGDSWREGINAQLSALTVDEAATGQLAAQTLEEIINGKRDMYDNTQFSMNVELYRGSTLGPAPTCLVRH